MSAISVVCSLQEVSGKILWPAVLDCQVLLIVVREWQHNPSSRVRSILSSFVLSVSDSRFSHAGQALAITDLILATLKDFRPSLEA